jgi:hypothetical protein
VREFRIGGLIASDPAEKKLTWRRRAARASFGKVLV